jgi:copper chaperone NosL
MTPARTRRHPGALRFLAAALPLAVAACGDGTLAPVTVDTRNDACAHCRMTVSDLRFAAQVVAPGEEPRVFDDLGCLRAYLAATPQPGSGSVAFVASYGTKAWVRAGDALYLQRETLETPMGSGIVAFEDVAGRDAEAAARGGRRMTAGEVFGASPIPGGVL